MTGTADLQNQSAKSYLRRAATRTRRPSAPSQYPLLLDWQFTQGGAEKDGGFTQ